MAGTNDSEKALPVFLQKLSSLMDDSAAREFIDWGSNGDTLLVKKPVEFAKEILPQYFKHSNFASFVRQLNLYGFAKTSQDPDLSEFKNKHFRKGCPEDMYNIKRKNSEKSNATSTMDMAKAKSEFQALMSDVLNLKARYQAVESNMQNVQRENQFLWQELVSSRSDRDILQRRIQQLAGIMTRVVGKLRDVQGLPAPHKRKRIANAPESYEEAQNGTDEIEAMLKDFVGGATSGDASGHLGPQQQQYSNSMQAGVQQRGGMVNHQLDQVPAVHFDPANVSVKQPVQHTGQSSNTLPQKRSAEFDADMPEVLLPASDALENNSELSQERGIGLDTAHLLRRIDEFESTLPMLDEFGMDFGDGIDGPIC